MSRMKLLFAVLCMAAIASVAPQAQAQVTLKVMIVGSSGIWQALGVGTYNNGNCPSGSNGSCAHYTNGSFNLNDTRPSLKGGTTAVDVAPIWIVWDNTVNDPTCATACNVWAYIKVDSTVGARCYFASPQCNVTSPSTFPGPSNSISSAIWGSDSTPPLPIQALFTASSGVKVNVGAVDVRPEDTLFAQCRANSQLGGGSDGLNGLGYGANPSGTCPAFGAALADLQGSDLTSSYPKSTGTAHVLAFNISGKDPFSNGTVATYSAVAVGAIPVVFVTERTAALAGVSDASLSQLQQAFSGANCNGTLFAGGSNAAFDVYLREPLSGTFNAIEYTAFRLPRDSAGNYAGISQETGIGGANPPNNIACSGTAPQGGRYGVIGTGDEVKSVLNSQVNNGLDGIGYTFFSYGNVSSIANSANYGYLTIGGIDPIFQVAGSTYDPGQPAIAGALPGAANLPATCSGAFPCAESNIWKGGLSFPNVRNGSYRQWSIIRLIGTGTPLTNAKALVTTAQASAVNSVPDFIPAVKSGTDPGLQLYRSHYTQEGVAPVNGITTDKGGEEGGCIISSAATKATKVVQREFGCVVGP